MSYHDLAEQLREFAERASLPGQRMFLREAADALDEAALAREAGLREALKRARQHLRPEVGGRFDQHAAVEVIDAALTAHPLEQSGDLDEPICRHGWAPSMCAYCSPGLDAPGAHPGICLPDRVPSLRLARGADCALNRGAVHCKACGRNWPPDETWQPQSERQAPK